MNRHGQRRVSFALRPVPLGWLGVVAGEKGLVAIVCRSAPEEARAEILERCPEAVREESEPVREAMTQLEEYFRGERRRFDLPLDLSGLPPFAALVLQRLRELPYGERITYGELAARAGRPSAARAVGRAMAANPFVLVVPCHRVVGAGGKLTGYSGGEGIGTKAWLLKLEDRFREKVGEEEQC